jgi:hypothetical protein
VDLAADFESDRLEWLSIGDGVQSGLDITGSLTLVGWMKAEQVWRWQMMASKYEWGVTNRAYRFGLNGGNGLHFVVSPDGQYLDGYILNGQTSLETGVWYHVAAVFDGQAGTMTLYLDGELDGTRTVVFSSINVSTAPFMLGANMQTGSVVQSFDGQLDEWRVYSRALSESEIEDLMTSSTPTPTATSTPTPTVTSTPTEARTPTPSGLEGYWGLDEASGQRQDISGQGNHLADNNTVESASGQVGLAADFESDRWEWLSISDAAQSGLDITGSLTLVGWMKAEQVDRWQMMVSKYEWGVTNRAYRFGLNGGNGLHFVVSPDGQYVADYILNGGTPLAAGVWYHVAAVFDAQAQTMTLYLDGEQEATRWVAFDSINASTAPFMLGANMSNGSVVQPFDGQLDEWRVYSRALSESEIENLMVP